MDRKDSVPAVSQPMLSSSALTGEVLREAALLRPVGSQAAHRVVHVHWSFTTLFSSGMVMSFEPNSTPSCARASVSARTRADAQKNYGRTVGSGFARNRWSVSRTRRDDFPTAASPTSRYRKKRCTQGHVWNVNKREERHKHSRLVGRIGSEEWTAAATGLRAMLGVCETDR